MGEFHADAALVESAALRLRSAQDRNESLAPITSTAPIDVATAYAIAARVHRMRLASGAVAIGRKIGFTNRNIWDEYGVHQPIWGWMYEHTLTRATSGRARIALGAFSEPRIEPEIVFRFASALPREASAADVLACVDWVAHGFEIVQSHFPDWKFRVADTIADGGLHAALVLGAPVPIGALGTDPLATLAALEIDLSCDGERRESGCGANVLGNPASAVAHLAAILTQLPQAASIGTGEIVTTGTLTSAYAIRPGEVWSTSLRGIALPGLTVEFVA